MGLSTVDVEIVNISELLETSCSIPYLHRLTTTRTYTGTKIPNTSPTPTTIHHSTYHIYYFGSFAVGGHTGSMTVVTMR
jgi:hypothetical protein